jgi:pentatricopeptide repeat protein
MSLSLTLFLSIKKARRIFKLMGDQQHPISAYSWSILVDIHSKLADFEGCHHVMKEMASSGVPPTQAAYTSLLSACYKVCNNGRIAHSIRAKAGELGWNQWQEMRIVGVETDAMAYGAIIRLCAARGHPERAINLLEDMERFDVKPTTLCFSSALRAVARSHATSIRFENGSSRKQLRRETIAAHHGKMARAITIMAENAEVEIDEGFVSALMLCAAEAGDSATAKAVYLAAQVRNMDHLRTIGPNSHLLRLRGKKTNVESSNPPLLELEGHPTLVHGGVALIEATGSLLMNTDDDTSLISGAKDMPVASNHSIPYPSYGEREYGRDTRALSALMHASSKAVSNDGIGTMWAGTQNQGYLCENSLRLLTARRKPGYKDNSIPGVNPTEVGIAALRRFDDHHRDIEEKPGSRKKFRGLFMDEDSATSMDELDDTFANIFGEDKNEGDIDENSEVEEFIWRGNVVATSNATLHSDTKKEDDTELFFDFDSMRWKSRPILGPEVEGIGMEENPSDAKVRLSFSE